MYANYVKKIGYSYCLVFPTGYFYLCGCSSVASPTLTRLTSYAATYSTVFIAIHYCYVFMFIFSLVHSTYFSLTATRWLPRIYIYKYTHVYGLFNLQMCK